MKVLFLFTPDELVWKNVHIVKFKKKQKKKQQHKKQVFWNRIRNSSCDSLKTLLCTVHANSVLTC